MPKKLIYDKVETKGKQNKAVVVIHGWKGNKDSFKSIASFLKLSCTTWFFPEAPFDFEGECPGMLVKKPVVSPAPPADTNNSSSEKPVNPCRY